MNTHGFWRYIEVLRSEMISLCKKVNIIYKIIIQRQTVRGDVQFTNESFFLTVF